MIAVRNLNKSYGAFEVIKNLSLKFEPGKTNVILGPSGCGKTTLLRIIAGLDKEYSGIIEGKPASMSFCFQEERLMEWKTAEENIYFVKEARERGRAENIMAVMNLKEAAGKKAANLSGGQKQRVAISRALYHNGEMLFMDEPFKSLDLSLKLEIIKDFNKIIETENKTVIVVSHDIDEALLLADTVFIFGKSPVTNVRQIPINIKKCSREINSKEIMEIEGEIRKILLGN